jgi:hypothetical protein
MTTQAVYRAVVAAIAALLMSAHAFAQTHRVTRTPWGDPDLQGTFTNKDEVGTPLERPAEFEGRRIEDITPAEFAAVLQKRHDDRPGVEAVAPGRVGPTEWQSQVDLTKGSRLWFVTSPLDGKIPALTTEGQARASARQEAQRGRGRADSWQDLALGSRCVTQGLPDSMMPGSSGNSYEIVQAPGYVAIRYERIHDVRVIPLDRRPHANVAARSHLGDARGRFEGDTLIVETTNFREESAYRGANPDRLRLVERFAPQPDGKLEWRVTVDDPSTWTAPWTFSMVLTSDPAERILEYACHEGNRAMTNILSGARAAERASQEPAK